MAEQSDSAADNAADQTGQGGQQTDDSSQQQSSGDADASQNQQQDEDMIPRSELQDVVKQRQSLKGQLGEVQGKLDDALVRTAKIPSDEDLQLLAEIKAERAEENKKKALKDGDADAIAAAARKPLELENQAQAKEITSLQGQLSTLLRDRALDDAIEASEHKPPDRRLVRDALYPRIKMVLKDGNYAAQFIGDDGMDLYDANGKVTDMNVFVNSYLAEHPTLCAATANAGSGAKPAGGQQQTGDEVLPTTTEEFNALDDEQKAKAVEKLGAAGIKALAGAGQKAISNTL